MKEFLITLFFGWLGAHRFMKKQYLIGAIYLCTLGGFGIGWTVDTILALVNVIKGKQPEKTVEPEKQTNVLGGGGTALQNVLLKVSTL